MKRGIYRRSIEFRSKQKKIVHRLRKNATLAERIFWRRCRGRQIDNLKFRRQHSIGRYTVDFYCDELCLVIELDGKIHDYLQSYDERRQTALENLGYNVIRFKNEEIYKSMDYVIEEITKAAAIIKKGFS